MVGNSHPVVVERIRVEVVVDGDGLVVDGLVVDKRFLEVVGNKNQGVVDNSCRLVELVVAKLERLESL